MQPNSTLHLDTWLYYFSGLAQTIAAGSSLIIALIVIRIQLITTTLNDTERSLSKLAYDLKIIDKFQETASPHLRNGNWLAYFEAIARIYHNEPGRLTGPEYGYDTSYNYLKSMLDSGIRSAAIVTELKKALTVAVAGTVTLSGVSIAVVPFVLWIGPTFLIVAWILSLAFCFIYLCLCIWLIRRTLAP